MPADPTIRLWLWLAATAGHFVLTARWLGRLSPRADRDERWFETMLAGTGTLVCLLHAAAVLVGLSLATGFAAIGIWHAALAVWLGTRAPAALPAAAAEGDRPGTAVRWLEVGAVATLVCVAWHWLATAAASLAITGTDAAHYHVPVAVNLAQGTSPFDLPATPHLYPMATSMLAAWFIVPLGDGLLVDLAMLIPFLLLSASFASLFRSATGASGLLWTTWLVLALFSTPMFRSAALMSADLLFTAACAALGAVLVGLWARSDVRAADLVLMGLAVGLLVGSKTTGLLAAVLMLALFVAAWLGRRRFRFGRPTPALWGAGVAAAALAVGAGGIWLVRNWVLFGSPIAPSGLTIAGLTIFPGEPLAPTSYLSVLDHLQKDPTYSLLTRAAHFVNQWFGAWYLPALVVAVVVPIDAAAAAWLGRRRDLAAARAWILAILVGVGVPMVWLLIGAPWTSLEWTNGFALRYVLPLFALVSLAAFLGAFPVTGRWYARPLPAAAAGSVLAVASVTMLVAAERRDLSLFVPGLSGSLLVGLPLYAAFFLVAGIGPRARVAAGVAGLLVVAPLTARFLADRDELARAVQGREPVSISAAREIYVAALDREARAPRVCDRRRFFLLTRLDEPLALQSIDYRNLVFYAARDVAVTARVRPMATCDYIVTSRAVMATDKGQALVTALDPSGAATEIAEARPFVLLGR